MYNWKFEQGLELVSFFSGLISGLKGNFGDVILSNDPIWRNNHSNLFMLPYFSVMIENFTTWHGNDFWAEEIGNMTKGILQ